MTDKEKAQAYDEAREKIALRFGSNVADEIFSQFGMSDDERISKEIISAIKEDWPGHTEWITWLERQGKKGTNGNNGEIPFLAWSEDDEENLNWFEKFFRSESVIAEGRDIPQDRYMWFKNLKDRVQPKEWSEEDNINCNRLLYFLNGGNLMQDHKIELFIWVKSLKDRYTWKPSGEQINALSCINVTGCISYVGQGQELINLYNDLKKLKGE